MESLVLCQNFGRKEVESRLRFPASLQLGEAVRPNSGHQGMSLSSEHRRGRWLGTCKPARKLPVTCRPRAASWGRSEARFDELGKQRAAYFSPCAAATRPLPTRFLAVKNKGTERSTASPKVRRPDGQTGAEAASRYKVSDRRPVV